MPVNKKETKTTEAPAKAPVASSKTKVEVEPVSKEFVKKAPKKVVEEDGESSPIVKKVEKKLLKNGKEDMSFLDASLPGGSSYRQNKVMQQKKKVVKI
jgi:hypothetical protein